MPHTAAPDPQVCRPRAAYEWSRWLSSEERAYRNLVRSTARWGGRLRDFDTSAAGGLLLNQRVGGQAAESEPDFLAGVELLAVFDSLEPAAGADLSEEDEEEAVVVDVDFDRLSLT